MEPHCSRIGVSKVEEDEFCVVLGILEDVEEDDDVCGDDDAPRSKDPIFKIAAKYPRD